MPTTSRFGLSCVLLLFSLDLALIIMQIKNNNKIIFWQKSLSEKVNQQITFLELQCYQ